MTYFYLFWILGCGLWAIGSLFFWNIVYAICVKFGIHKNDDNCLLFIIVMVINLFLVLLTAIAPFNNWFTPQ